MGAGTADPSVDPAVRSVSLSPDGEFFVSGSASGAVLLTEVTPSGGGELYSIAVYDEEVNGVCLARPDTLFVCGSLGTIRYVYVDWTRRDGLVTAKEHLSWKDAHEGKDVTCLSAADEGAVLASSGKDGTVRLWDGETGRETNCLRGHKSWVKCVTLAVSNEGLGPVNLVASAGRDKTVKLWDVRAGSSSEIHTFYGHGGWVHSVDFSEGAGQPKLVSASGDKTVRVWNLSTLSEELVLRDHMFRVWSAAVDETATTVVSGSEDDTVRRWDLASSPPKSEVVEQCEDAVLTVALSRSGKLFAGGTAGGRSFCRSSDATEQAEAAPAEAIASRGQATIELPIGDGAANDEPIKLHGRTANLLEAEDDAPASPVDWNIKRAQLLSELERFESPQLESARELPVDPPDQSGATPTPPVTDGNVERARLHSDGATPPRADWETERVRLQAEMEKLQTALDDQKYAHAQVERDYASARDQLAKQQQKIDEQEALIEALREENKSLRIPKESPTAGTQAAVARQLEFGEPSDASLVTRVDDIMQRLQQLQLQWSSH